MKQAIGVIFSLVIGIGLAVFFVKTKPKAKQRPAKRPLVSVKVEKAEPVKGPLIFEGTGIVKAASSVVITPEVRGKVVWINPGLIPGSTIKKGEVLVRLEDTDYRAMLKERQAQLERAKLSLMMEQAQAQVAKADWKRAPLRHPTPQAKALALHIPQVNAAKAAVDAAVAGVRQAKLNLQRTVIRAPFDAVIIEKNVAVGDVVGPGSRLCRLTGTGEFWITTDIPVQYMRWVKEDSDVVVTPNFDTSYRWKAKIKRILKDVAEGGALGKVLVAVSNPLEGDRPLRLGEFVRVKIKGPVLKNTVWVSRVALQKPGIVWIADATNHLRARHVTVLIRRKNRAIVQGDLKPGDRVVISRLEQAFEGMLLKVF